MTLWGIEIDDSLLKREELEFLSRYSNSSRPDVHLIWRIMDDVWDQVGLNDREQFMQSKISDFYSHPVWLLNGVFTATDPESVGHRKAIAKYIRDRGFKKVADFGGGFGSLACEIAQTCPDVTIDIVEPYPSKIGVHRTSDYKNVAFVSKLSSTYDCIVAQDILEHVPDPIKLASELAEHATSDGHLIFANCFYPVIKCHLPETFYLRRTFSWVVKPLALKYMGVIDGCEHANIFVRTLKGPQLATARNRETLARVIGTFLNRAQSFIKRDSKA